MASVDSFVDLNNKGVDLVLEGNPELASKHFRNSIGMLKSMLALTIVKAICNTTRKENEAIAEIKTADSSTSQAMSPVATSSPSLIAHSSETPDTIKPAALVVSTGIPQEYMSSLLASQHLHICARPIKLSAKFHKCHANKEDFRHRNMASAITFNLALSYHLLSCMQPSCDATSRYQGHAISLYGVAFKLLATNLNSKRNHSDGDSLPPQADTFAMLFLYILNNLGILHHQAGNTTNSRYFFTRLSLQIHSGENDCEETMELRKNLVKMGFARGSLPSAPAA